MPTAGALYERRRNAANSPPLLSRHTTTSFCSSADGAPHAGVKESRRALRSRKTSRHIHASAEACCFYAAGAFVAWRPPPVDATLAGCRLLCSACHAGCRSPAPPPLHAMHFRAHALSRTLIMRHFRLRTASAVLPKTRLIRVRRRRHEHIPVFSILPPPPTPHAFTAMISAMPPPDTPLRHRFMSLNVRDIVRQRIWRK